MFRQARSPLQPPDLSSAKYPKKEMFISRLGADSARFQLCVETDYSTHLLAALIAGLRMQGVIGT